MKKAIIAIAAIGIIGAGGYGVYHHFFENTNSTQERVSSSSADAVYVDKVSAITGYGSGNGLIDRYGGEVEPQATLEVKLESERTVKECFVKEGDEVKEGQKLFVYNTQDDEDKLAQAQIDIERAEGEIDVLKQSITQYEKDKQNSTSSEDDQLMITTNILTAQNDIKQKEYEIKTKQLEMKNLQESIDSAEVTAEMDGIIQKIADSSDSSSAYGSSESSAYITILAAGDFRIKGSINEQNLNAGLISEGMYMLIHSRVDDTQTWRGTISEIKTDKPEEESSDSMYYGYGSSSDSSSYAFYVELESSEGLILGQHVYMEEDAGQDVQKDGLWLEEYYIIQEDDKAYVWMADAQNLIAKHEITLGDYDEDMMEYEITGGLDPEDYITFPQDTVKEGTPVIYNDYESLTPDAGAVEEDYSDLGDMGDTMDGVTDMGEDLSADGSMDFAEDAVYDANDDLGEDLSLDEGGEIGADAAFGADAPEEIAAPDGNIAENAEEVQ